LGAYGKLSPQRKGPPCTGKAGRVRSKVPAVHDAAGTATLILTTDTKQLGAYAYGCCHVGPGTAPAAGDRPGSSSSAKRRPRRIRPLTQRQTGPGRRFQSPTGRRTPPRLWVAHNPKRPSWTPPGRHRAKRRRRPPLVPSASPNKPDRSTKHAVSATRPSRAQNRMQPISPRIREKTL